LNKSIAILAALLILFGCAQDNSNSAKDVSTATVADVVYTNGKIYTVDKTQPWAEAAAIKDGKFLVVGSVDDVALVTGTGTQVIDLDGSFVMPGLIDVHNHVLGASMGRANLYLQNPNDPDAMLAEIEAYADANPDLPFIRGESWNLGVFPDNSPRKELLDAVVSDRPVYFYSQTGHSAWVNSRALELIGLDENSEQVGSYIWDTDPETNEPTGTIREYAMAAMEQALGPTEPSKFAPAIQQTLAQFSQWGFTSLKPAEGEISWVEAANILDGQGELDVRLFPSWFHRAHISAMTAEESRVTATNWQKYESPMVYPRYVKMYFDGSPDSYTSLLLEDYVGRPGFKGATHLPTEEFIEEFTFFNEQGIGMLVHVFGDGSSRELVRAFEAVRDRNGDNGVPLHFSHSFLTRPQEIERLSKVADVCMDFIPLTYPHPAIEGSFLPPIGEDRYQTFFNARSAVEAGIPIAIGSDWPSTLDPIPNGFSMMQTFVTRRDPSNPDYAVLNPGQAITLEQAVRAFTQGGAECLGFDWPDKLGSIEASKLADLIVLDRNIFEIPIAEVYETRVRQTVVGGVVVFEANK